VIVVQLLYLCLSVDEIYMGGIHIENDVVD